MKFSALTKVLTAATLAVSSFTVNMNTSQAGYPPLGGGFWCEQGAIPKTKFLSPKYGKTKVWINWVPGEFDYSGYTPDERCEIVSQKLETFRISGQLNLVSIGKVNNYNVLCVAHAPGICKPGGDIYTLKKAQDPVRTLNTFVTLLSEPGAVVELFESGGGIPYVDLSSALTEESTSNNPPVFNPAPASIDRFPPNDPDNVPDGIK